IPLAHAQGFGFFLPPPVYAPPPPPGRYYGPDFYDEAEPYYDEGPRDYRPLPRRRPHSAPVVRRKKPTATAVRKAPAPHKAAALAVPPKTTCDEARSSVAGFGF